MTRLKKAEKEAQRIEAIAMLREIVKPGDRVYTVLRHVSSSGMSRRITVIAYDNRKTHKRISNSENIMDITWLVARALDYRRNDNDGALVIGGCGMDMGFNVVYSLSSVLYRGNFHCLGQNCSSNDHLNGMQRPEKADKTLMHSDGGYALKHSWL